MKAIETIDIWINDVPEQVATGSTLADLIRRFEEGDPDLIVERNGRFVYPRAYVTTTVAAGDRLEFINPNFGG